MTLSAIDSCQKMEDDSGEDTDLHGLPFWRRHWLNYKDLMPMRITVLLLIILLLLLLIPVMFGPLNPWWISWNCSNKNFVTRGAHIFSKLQYPILNYMARHSSVGMVTSLWTGRVRNSGSFTFFLSWLRFFRAFSSVVKRMPW